MASEESKYAAEGAKYFAKGDTELKRRCSYYIKT